MVTFRFYLVSIVAFFLALAVGVVVGSVLDEGISNSLQDRLERVEANLDDTVASIDDKNREIDQLGRYAEASAPFAVQDRLLGTSTLVVAESGVDDDPVEDLVVQLRRSGAHVPGVVWLEPRWSLTEDEDKGRFAEIVDGTDLSVAQLHEAAWAELLSSAAPDGEDITTTTTVSEGGDPPGTTTTEVAAGQPLDLFEDPMLVALSDAGFLRLVEIDGDDAPGGAELGVIAVTGTSSELPVPGAAAVDLIEQSSAVDVPAVLAEVYVDDSSDDEDAPERGVIVRAATERSTPGYSSVDDLDVVAGRVAAVLALDDQRHGLIGRFGYGPDVDGVLPRWPRP
ncbi:MAG: copper transporter [Microthrixaceae bacterium]